MLRSVNQQIDSIRKCLPEDAETAPHTHRLSCIGLREYELALHTHILFCDVVLILALDRNRYNRNCPCGLLLLFLLFLARF